MSLTITVLGLPAPQGSKRHVGNGIMVESSKRVRPWRSDVKAAAERAIGADWAPIKGPVSLTATFSFLRPRSHYRTGRFADVLRDDAPVFATSRACGDIDKLLRSTLDALTAAGVIVDDSQVGMVITTKTYGTTSGATIALTEVKP